MKQLIDVVNFNADASCLECNKWFQFLEGGKTSVFYKWLNLYVGLNKKVVLGIPGATLSDISQSNPEAIDLINDNLSVFEIIVRPFAHDNALLRTRFGFEKNLEYGIKTLNKLFDHYTPYFLPPEFMLNSEQVYVLSQLGIKATFVNHNRFSEEARSRIPEKPYNIRGVFGSKMGCVPFTSELTKGFLDGIHFYDAEKWNNAIAQSNERTLFNWRDGESAFLIPDTVEREKAWLEGESSDFERVHIQDLGIDYTENNQLESTQYKGYPFHSFAPWLKEMRMIGFTNKVAKIEEILDTLSDEKIFHWLQIINSDILSSVEKDSPNIKIQKSRFDSAKIDFRIWRTERAFEGEDYLTLLKESEKTDGHDDYTSKTDNAHIKKFVSRLEFLSSL